MKSESFLIILGILGLMTFTYFLGLDYKSSKERRGQNGPEIQCGSDVCIPYKPWGGKLTIDVPEPAINVRVCYDKTKAIR